MQNSTKRVLAAVAVSICLMLASQAIAQQTFEYGVDLSVENLVATDRIVNTNAAPVNLSLNNPPYGVANGFSHVGTGVNKAAARLSVASTLTDPLVIGYANAYAYWYDQVTIEDPTQTGQPGTFTATMLVNGTGNVTGSGPWLNDPDIELYAVWQGFIGVFIDEDFQEDGWYGWWESDPTSGQLASGGAQLGQLQAELTFNFVFGEPFVLSGRLQTYMDVFNVNETEGTFDSDLDLGNSAYWGGLRNIRNAAGQPVPGATVTSASGVQWQNAIDPRLLRGDFDTNGVVNLDDFNILAGNFGMNVTPWTIADATGDGLVNLNDFNILAANFGLPTVNGVPTPEDWATLAAAVPEPALAGLGLVLLMAAASRRRN